MRPCHARGAREASGWIVAYDLVDVRILMRSGLKRGLEAALVRSGVARFARAGLHSRVLVLAYHNVVPDGAAPGADASLHLPQHHFAEQLDALVRTHDIVPLDDLAEIGSGRGKPRVAITFDDAYRGAVTAGIEELARRGLPATIFVAPHFLGGRSFWWDAVPPPATMSPDAFRSHVLQALRGEDAAVRQWAVDMGLEMVAADPYAVAATEEELRTAVRHAGITLGSHTWSHPNLARLEPVELTSELSRPLLWLQERFPSATVAWLTYPYGLSSLAVERAAAAAGYRGALRASGGWGPASPTNLPSLPRFNVPAGLSDHGFRLRISGLFC